eukprot:TRINITY_DN1142_c0_g1_i1.p1 TRINITY_DN1142_c0_g1~~TRINITY_DN1142_c0_g1_i1.p1  ORF type:complete len:678 (-),score=111.44 TRINITY_DN1142_c0_g1_i1:113-2146(-)
MADKKKKMEALAEEIQKMKKAAVLPKGEFQKKNLAHLEASDEEIYSLLKNKQCLLNIPRNNSLIVSIILLHLQNRLDIQITMEAKYLSRLNAFWRSPLSIKGPLFPKKQLFIEGHRGCKGIAPENTLRAFKKAIELGCDSVELDVFFLQPFTKVWLTKDKHIVVIHGKDDGDISATTNGHGKVTELTLAELQKFDAGEGEKVPLLEEVLNLCKGKAFVNIEIKPLQDAEIVGKVIEMIEKMSLFEGCCVSSFNHDFLGMARTMAKDKLELGYLYDANKNTKLPDIEYITSHGNTANICFLDITPELAEKVHEKGMGLMAWITSEIPKEEEWYEKIIKAGTDVLCVNSPNLLIEFLKQEKPKAPQLQNYLSTSTRYLLLLSIIIMYEKNGKDKYVATGKDIKAFLASVRADTIYHPEKEEESREVLAKKEVEKILKHMRELSDKRLEALKSHLYKTLVYIEADELLETMENDTTTRDFITDRIHEIFQVHFVQTLNTHQDSIIHEQEAQIHKLTQKLAVAKQAKTSQAKEVYETVHELRSIIQIKDTEMEALKQEMAQMEHLVAILEKKLDIKEYSSDYEVNDSKYADELRREYEDKLKIVEGDIYQLAEEKEKWRRQTERLEYAINQRKVLENEAFKQYKQEIDRFKREWIPIEKHEEIVNNQLAEQRAELLLKNEM